MLLPLPSFPYSFPSFQSRLKSTRSPIVSTGPRGRGVGRGKTTCPFLRLFPLAPFRGRSRGWSKRHSSRSTFRPVLPRHPSYLSHPTTASPRLASAEGSSGSFPCRRGPDLPGLPAALRGLREWVRPPRAPLFGCRRGGGGGGHHRARRRGRRPPPWARGAIGEDSSPPRFSAEVGGRRERMVREVAPGAPSPFPPLSRSGDRRGPRCRRPPGMGRAGWRQKGGTGEGVTPPWVAKRVWEPRLGLAGGSEPRAGSGEGIVSVNLFRCGI